MVGSLAGVGPSNRESGQWKGKSFISGGRKPLRDALCMRTLVAIVALKRKLIETANALVKADRISAPKTS